MNNEKRIKELEDLIIKAKKNYYSFDDDIDRQMSDTEYDLLEDELRKLDPNNKVLRQVGYEDSLVNKFEQIVHKIPMLSMDKAHKKEDIAKWFNNTIKSCGIKDNKIIVEPKIDGVSGDMYFKDGKFMYASTRGNGHIGFKIFDNFLNCIIKEIPIKGDLHIRGEFYIDKSYNLIREKEDDESLRNICSGALKRKEKGEIHKYIKFIAYQLISDNYKTEEDKIKELKKTKFDVVPYLLFDNIDSIWNYFNEYQNHIRDSWKYETDGLVLIFNSIEVQNKIVKELGDTDHHHKYAIAIKPQPLGAWTLLKDIDWSTSRNGRVIPTGIVDPIQIGPVIVNRASLNNISYIKTNDIKLFDKVLCIRANDVIPNISRSIHTTDSKDISLDKCPSCGTKLEMRGVDYYCPNYLNCPAQIINKFLYWFEINGIKNIGPNMMDSLINSGHFYAIWQLYAMNEDDLMNMIEKYCGINKNTDTMKEFKTTFEKSKDQTEQEIIGKYGIPGIGIKSIKKLNIKDLNDLVKYKNPNYMRSDMAIESKLSEWLNKDEKNFDDLFSLIKFINPKKTSKENNKTYKYFCITGSFPNKKRNTIIEEIESEYPNWKFIDSVTKETNLLIVGNEIAITNKVISANKLMIPIIKLTGDFDLGGLKCFTE